MKKLFSYFAILSLALTIALTSSCKDDDLSNGQVEFKHDGDNVDAPAFGAGFFEAAARFINTYPGNDDGSELIEIQYYIKDIPNAASIKVYAGGIATPEDVIYEAEITGDLVAETWITHTPASPIVLDGRDLWIAIRFSQDADLRVVGCDGGPADSNGDWIYDENLGFWQALVDRTGGGVNINWNIRGTVQTAQ